MRGSVHRLRRPKDALGHEQSGQRFGVVVQATRLLHLSRWLVVPTSSSDNVVPGVLRPVVDWGNGETAVLCDAMQSVDPQVRLGERVGDLTFDELRQVDRALVFLLDLP
ncbi:type II toxin-antitoxin system PemK/MazF family toxin [Kineosporia sp. J2-2]|uniref:Type II toxin-antitoxin system PemK/MazF family toxin n=1 Tax=Kineosporia corallincola TaxID=2835133 RepID=A0ABS5TE78_9ACTN|nr:type II toxin-antitoxin system PemK/MazF family toxin [Kineosporia corallincola]MBT0769383.1 type II toxin-antitoxin system PemK/MazF family toxin [Kineosporia corallincola]